jgi:phosphoglycerate dehydrogenase-like enzyme
MTPVLHGKTMGIIGLGRIGRHVASLATAFGMSVVAWSPRLTASAAESAGARRVELDELLAVSDVVSLHASLTAESRHLLDDRRLRLMRRGSFLINTSRGPLVDETALIAVLHEGVIGGAGLDVFDGEPLPAGHPLTRLDNVVLTPHLGWTTDDGYERFSSAACDVLLTFLDGRDVPRFEH